MTKGEKRNIINNIDAGWSSLEARRAHNPKVIGSNPVPATRKALPRVVVLFKLTTYVKNITINLSLEG